MSYPKQPPNMFPLDSQIFLRFSFLFPDDNKCKNRHNYDDSDADSWSSFENEMLLPVPLDKRKRSTRSYTDSIIPIFYLIFIFWQNYGPTSQESCNWEEESKMRSPDFQRDGFSFLIIWKQHGVLFCILLFLWFQT